MGAVEREARGRVEEIYAAIDRLGRESLWTPLPTRDLEDRKVRLAALERAVDEAGRGPLLDESRQWLHDALSQRLGARGRQPEVAVWGISEIGRPEDIAAVRVALEDVVAVAIAIDLIDRDDAAVLSAPGFAVLGMPPLAEAGTALGPGTVAGGDPATPAAARPAWEPSAADWEASDDGGPSSVAWRWWTAPQEASQGRLLAVVIIAVVGAAAGGSLFGLAGILVVGTLAAGVGWLLVGIPRQDEPEPADDDATGE